MSNNTIKNKGDFGVWGDLDRPVSRETYGGQILTSVIFPENPETGYEGDIIPCNELDGIEYKTWWSAHYMSNRRLSELDRRFSEGYQFVQVNPEDPTTDQDSKGNVYNWRLPQELKHRATSEGHVRTELGELLWIPKERYLENEKRRNPSRYADEAQRDLQGLEDEALGLARQTGFGVTKTERGVERELVRPR
jgi:hypothetical protein